MTLTDTAAIVVDTSVLLNFVKVGRIDLMQFIGVSLLLPDDVYAEVTRPEQRAVVDRAVAAGVLIRETIADLAEVVLFAERAQSGRFGPGERATMAVALVRGSAVAIQERPAQAEMLRRNRHAKIITTEDIIICAIRSGAITVADADALLVEWRTRHRFASRLATFRDFFREV